MAQGARIGEPPELARPDVLLVIPAYQPGRRLGELVLDLARAGERFDILIVDDGSSAAARPVFDEAALGSRVRVLRHEQNRGKGAALKTAISYAREAGYRGVVTADADGQHLAGDILSVMEEGRKSDAFVVGVRAFGPGVPLRSRLGNALTARLVQALFRISLGDTQSGLRYIPASLFERLLEIGSNRYEFEFEALIRAGQAGPIVQVPIATVYENDNAGSHFNPLLDSGRIYLVFLRYSIGVLAVSLADLGTFLLLSSWVPAFLAFALVRPVTALAYFLVMRRVVFRSTGPLWRQSALFLALVIVNVLVSLGVFSLLDQMSGLGPLLLYLLSTGAMFIVNFLVQRHVIFYD